MNLRMSFEQIKNNILIKDTQNNSIKNDIFSLLDGNNFQETINKLQGEVDNYTQIEIQAEEKRKILFQSYKDKKLTAQEYTHLVKELLPWDILNNPRYGIEKKIRELEVQHDIENVLPPNILYNENQLGENISDG